MIAGEKGRMMSFAVPWVSTDNPTAVDTVYSYPNLDGNIHQFSYNSLHEAQSEENRHSSKEYLVKEPGTSNLLLTSDLPGKSASVPMPSKAQIKCSHVVWSRMGPTMKCFKDPNCPSDAP